MSPTATSLFGRYRNPITSFSAILRIAIVILITQLVNSMSYGHLDNNAISEDYKKDSGFKFRSEDFELTFDVFHVKDEDENPGPSKPVLESDDEMVNKAIHDGIFYPPDKIPNKISPSKDNFDGEGFVRPRLGDGRDPEMFKPTVPEKCENELICEDDLSYPVDAVAEVVKDLKDLRVLAVVEDEPIGDRTADDGTQNLCVSEHMTWYPRSVRKSRSDPWHRVVNVDSFKQGFRVVHCRKVDEPCSGSFDVVEAGQTAVCKQQYSYRQLAVFSPDNGTAFANLFPVPSGCCCHKKSTNVISARMLRDSRDSIRSHHPWFANNYRGHRRRNN